jgi:hypothetical protein
MYPHQESNPDQGDRSPSFYPLNYGGIVYVQGELAYVPIINYHIFTSFNSRIKTYNTMNKATKLARKKKSKKAGKTMSLRNR